MKTQGRSLANSVRQYLKDLRNQPRTQSVLLAHRGKSEAWRTMVMPMFLTRPDLFFAGQREDEATATDLLLAELDMILDDASESTVSSAPSSAGWLRLLAFSGMVQFFQTLPDDATVKDRLDTYQDTLKHLGLLPAKRETPYPSFYERKSAERGGRMP